MDMTRREQTAEYLRAAADWFAAGDDSKADGFLQEGAEGMGWDIVRPRKPPVYRSHQAEIDAIRAEGGA